MSLALSRRLTVAASTKRSPATASGKVGAQTTRLASVFVTALDPASAEMVARYGTGAPEVLLSCFTLETDIRAGDRLVVGALEYPIRAVAEWSGMGNAGPYRQLILEAIKS